MVVVCGPIITARTVPQHWEGGGGAGKKRLDRGGTRSVCESSSLTLVLAFYGSKSGSWFMWTHVDHTMLRELKRRIVRLCFHYGSRKIFFISSNSIARSHRFSRYIEYVVQFRVKINKDILLVVVIISINSRIVERTRIFAEVAFYRS